LGWRQINGLVVRTVKGGIEDPTILISDPEDVIRTISNASDPITAFQHAKEAGNILDNGKQLFH